MSSPLRRRLIVLAAVAILPITLLAAAGLYYMTRQQDEQARRVGVELARSVANSVSTELRGSMTILQALATAPSLDRNDAAAFHERAVRIAGVQHGWAAIVLSDASGSVVIDTRVPQGSPARPVFDTESFDQVLRMRAPAVGWLVKQNEEWLFPIRVPVIRDGQLRYVLTALVRPSAVRDVISRQQIPEDWIISIVDQHGLRVARSRAHELNVGGQLSPTARQVVARGLPEGTGVSISLEGDEIFTPYSSVQPFGWQAVLGIPTRSLTAAMWRSSLVLGSGVLLSILIGTLAAGWVARGITGPIGQLRDAAVALGRREVPTFPDASFAEVRDVSDALAKASQQIASYESEREELLAKERAARESAERANRAKDEFMAVLSHELRTPLNAVFGWARLLQSRHLQGEAQMTRAIDAIVRNADAQVRLIDDLLDLSRISSGKMQLAMEPVRLKDVTQGAMDAIRPSADQKGIRIVVLGDDDVVIVGDAARLQQIIWNLLANAVKFTNTGGEILLRQEAAGGHVEIAVSDTGQGIAAEILPHVFDRFRQGDSSSTRSHGGLGLGLALVRDLVALHGGTVTATSAGIGCGSTFVVRLPAVPAATAIAPSSQPELTPESLMTITRLDGLRIVVVDDEADALALAETILTTAGAVVRTTASAAGAVDLLRELKPHVLVSDLEMPDEDGYALVRKVRTLSAEEGGGVPAIALSAYGRPQDRTRAIAAGFNMHVPKPVDPGELTAIVAGLASPANASAAAADDSRAERGPGNAP